MEKFPEGKKKILLKNPVGLVKFFETRKGMDLLMKVNKSVVLVKTMTYCRVVVLINNEAAGDQINLITAPRSNGSLLVGEA